MNTCPLDKHKILTFAETNIKEMYRTNTCGELNIKNEGLDVILCGWVQISRDLGGMTFVDLRDRYGITQLVFNMETDRELCEKARKLGREFVVQAKGKVRERSNKNLKMVTGQDLITQMKLPAPDTIRSF